MSRNGTIVAAFVAIALLGGCYEEVEPAEIEVVEVEEPAPAEAKPTKTTRSADLSDRSGGSTLGKAHDVAAGTVRAAEERNRQLGKEIDEEQE